MARERRKNLKMLVNDALQSMCLFGVSRHVCKQEGTDSQYIFSYNSYHTYQQQCHRYCTWLKEFHPEVKTLEDAKLYVNEYLQHLIELDMSPYSIKTAASALGKLYQCKTTEWIATPQRNRVNITRSRNRVKRDVHWNETANAQTVEFLSSVGLRRAEVMALRGTWLIQQDGCWYIDLTHTSATKGGRPRMVPVTGDVELVVSMCKAAGEGKVFPRGISCHCDIHHYRAVFCQRVYDSVARDIKKLPRKERYCCRGDKASIVYDKAAMKQCALALGHNRIEICRHYLY